MDAYLKDQLDFTGVKVVLFVEKSILVVLREISQIFLGQICGNYQVVEERA